MLNLEFYKKLTKICSELQMKPEDLLLIMKLESGISPTAHNPSGNASGLIQFMPSTLKNMGYTDGHEKFRTLDAIAQLDYVKAYIEQNMKLNGGPFKSAARCYVSIFFPVALGLPGIQREDMSTPIVSADGTQPKYKSVSPSFIAKAYAQNKGLDTDKDGIISYGDLDRKLQSLKNNKDYVEAVQSLRAVSGGTPEEATDKMLDTQDKFNPENSKKDAATFLSKLFDGLKSMWGAFAANDIYGTYIIKVAGNTEQEVLEYSRIIQRSVEEQLNCKASINYSNLQSEILINCDYDVDYETFVKQINAYFQEEFNKKYSTNITTSLAKFGTGILPEANYHKIENAYLFFRKK